MHTKASELFMMLACKSFQQSERAEVTTSCSQQMKMAPRHRHHGNAWDQEVCYFLPLFCYVFFLFYQPNFVNIYLHLIMN